LPNQFSADLAFSPVYRVPLLLATHDPDDIRIIRIIRG
jgi:hypothetical protein